MEAIRRELPVPVWLAAIFGFAKAGFLALMGVIGLFAWEGVSDPWGIGALILAAIVIWLLYGLRSSKEYFGT